MRRTKKTKSVGFEDTYWLSEAILKRNGDMPPTMELRASDGKRILHEAKFYLPHPTGRVLKDLRKIIRAIEDRDERRPHD